MARDFLSYVVLRVPARLVCFAPACYFVCTKYGGKCSFMWTGSRFMKYILGPFIGNFPFLYCGCGGIHPRWKWKLHRDRKSATTTHKTSSPPPRDLH